MPPPPTPTAAVFVRIPTAEADKLDRAAFELRMPKRELIAGLVSRYVDPSTPAGLDALRSLGTPRAAPRPAGFAAPGLSADVRRVVVETGPDPLTIGRHDFQATEPPEVLTPGQLAHLLQLDEGAVRGMAEAGELPGRRIGEDWRFSRPAILRWLAAEDDDGED